MTFGILRLRVELFVHAQGLLRERQGLRGRADFVPRPRQPLQAAGVSRIGRLGVGIEPAPQGLFFLELVYGVGPLAGRDQYVRYDFQLLNVAAELRGSLGAGASPAAAGTASASNKNDTIGTVRIIVNDLSNRLLARPGAITGHKLSAAFARAKKIAPTGFSELYFRWVRAQFVLPAEVGAAEILGAIAVPGAKTEGGMSTPATADDLIKLIRKSGLIEETKLTGFLSNHQKDDLLQADAQIRRPADPRRRADVLPGRAISAGQMARLHARQVQTPRAHRHRRHGASVPMRTHVHANAWP